MNTDDLLNTVICGDCLEYMKAIPDNSVDACVTDPPYELGFMGKTWDNSGIANNPDMWREVLRVLKPGGHLLSFSGTRTYHRQAVAIEDAGFEIRDMVEWVYASGFPKSTNVQKQLIKQCKCGNMEAYDRAKQKAKHDLRPMQETDISQEITDRQTTGEVLQSVVSQQDVQIQQPKPTEDVWGGQPSLEGRSDAQENSRQLSGDNLSEMPERVPSDGEERRIHNATPPSDGSTPKQTINENGSGTPHRPQPSEQPDREPCAFCRQYGTQEVRRFYDELDGLGSSLKPSHEPICLARKPLEKGRTILSNVLKYGTGGINIDGSRVDYVNQDDKDSAKFRVNNKTGNPFKELDPDSFETIKGGILSSNTGRFPANLIHDGSDEVVSEFPNTKSGKLKSDCYTKDRDNDSMFAGDGKFEHKGYEADSGSASRFFKSFLYCPKASKSKRDRGCEGMEDITKGSNFGNDGPRPHTKEDYKYEAIVKNNHPTVKPLALMKYLIQMITPEGGVVLDPFAGSGSTLVAAKELGYDFIGIEMTPEYIPIIEARLSIEHQERLL